MHYVRAIDLITVNSYTFLPHFFFSPLLKVCKAEISKTKYSYTGLHQNPGGQAQMVCTALVPEEQPDSSVVCRFMAVCKQEYKAGFSFYLLVRDLCCQHSALGRFLWIM